MGTIPTRQDQLQEKVALISKKLEQSEEKIHTSESKILELQNNRPAYGKSLDEDKFSIMMTSKLCSLGWALGLITFFHQMTLIFVILYGYFKLSAESTPFDAPINVDDIFVRIGQFFAVILSVFNQKDIFEFSVLSILFSCFAHLHRETVQVVSMRHCS